MKQFRKKLPFYETVESKNKLNLDLRMQLALITQLRHHIVHTGGKVRDREIFAQKVLEEIGRWNNGKPAQENLDVINQYFFISPNETTIALRDIRLFEHKLDNVANRYIDVLQLLCRSLVSIAYVLTVAIESYPNSPATEIDELDGATALCVKTRLVIHAFPE